MLISKGPATDGAMERARVLLKKQFEFNQAGHIRLLDFVIPCRGPSLIETPGKSRPPAKPERVSPGGMKRAAPAPAASAAPGALVAPPSPRKRARSTVAAPATATTASQGGSNASQYSTGDDISLGQL